jgi:hypothetical protein
MNLGQLLTIWNLRDIVVQRSLLTVNCIYESKAKHVTSKIVIANRSTHAIIMYSYEDLKGSKSKFKFIYADILFSGFPERESNSQVYRRNANLTDLQKEFT